MSVLSLPLAISIVMYACGAQRLRSRRAARTAHEWYAAAFAAGCVVIAAALLSPLDDMSEQLFAAHMVQHELLMVVAAPLLVVGRPTLTMLWGLPKPVRLGVGALVSSRVWRFAWRKVSRPFHAWLIHAIVIWVWHVPAFFQTALRSDTVHAIQHLSFLGSALLFWWVVLFPRRQERLGMSIVYLFATALHTGVLGALMSVSRTVWYPAYSGVTPWALTPIQDQQLAGLVMWIPSSMVYLGAALVVLSQWLRRAEWRVPLPHSAMTS